MKTFFQWLRANHLLIFVTVIAGILRFYRLEALTTFGGDQGVDYQNVARMILKRDPTLLGPVTHVGVYLGPLYYYLLLPFFLVFRFDPIAAPVFFALIGTATVGLVFVLFRKFLSPLHAFLGSLVYASLPVIIESSRAPSQPHLIPFLSVLLLLSTIRIVEKKATKWDAFAIGIVLGSAIQFHYLTIPMYAFTLIVGGWIYLRSDSENRKHLSSLATYCLLLTTFLLAPLFLFELLHRFFITNQILAFLSGGEIGVAPSALAGRMLDLIWFSFDRILGQGSQIVTFLMIVAAIVGFLLMRTKRMLVIVLYAAINISGLSLYRFPLSNHYISALYPLVMLLPVVGISVYFNKKTNVILLLMLVAFVISHYRPFRNSGYTMPEELTTTVIKDASRIISEDVETDRYEVANLLDGDTRAQPYRYVLTAMHRKPSMAVEDYPLAQTLYVIGRNDASVVANNTVWELWSMSPKHLVKTWRLTDTIVLYRFDRG